MRTVLISGLGIAGPTLAYWLHRAGFAPTIVEHAPAPRAGGYVIDFWGSGYDVAERMGVLPEVLAAGYRVREVRLVDARGGRAGGFDAEVFRTATAGRFTSIPRGALATVLHRAIAGQAEVLFGDRITALSPAGAGVRAQFERAPARTFDLVVGADGLHSRVRALALGGTEEERYLGYVVGAFEVSGYRPRDEDVYITYSEPGREIMRFALRDDRTMFLIVLAEDDPPAVLDRAYVARRCEGMRWETPAILAEMARCDDVYIDRVSQIHMPHWSSGRSALVGDAAYAPSLLAGEGSGLAMLGAYILAGELSTAPTIDAALARYEATLRPFLAAKQAAAARFAGSFAPRTRLGIFLRNQITRAFSLPYVARLAVGRTLTDRFDLPSF